MISAKITASTVIFNLAAVSGPAIERSFAGDSGPDASISWIEPERLERIAQHLKEKTVSKVSFKDGELSGPYGILKKDQKPIFKNLFFVNGIDTSGERAVEMSQKVAGRLESKSYLVYNDLNLRCENDEEWFEVAASWIEKRGAIIVEKLGDYDCSVNEATETLLKQLRLIVGKGEEIFLVAHSAGAMCVLNALREFDDASEDKKDLARVHVLTVGSAVLGDDHVLCDGWPKGLGSVHHLYDARDPVSNIFGPGELGGGEERYHNLTDHYLEHITAAQLRVSGSTIIPEKSHAEQRNAGK